MNEKTTTSEPIPNSSVPMSGTTVRSRPTMPPTKALTRTRSENCARFSRRPSRTCTSRGVHRCHDFSACTFTPLTPYLRATRSFEVPPKGSKYSVMRTDRNPTDSNTNRSSASGRAPAIQPVHKIDVAPDRLGEFARHDDVRIEELTTRLEDPEHLAECLSLVRRQIRARRC